MPSRDSSTAMCWSSLIRAGSTRLNTPPTPVARVRVGDLAVGEQLDLLQLLLERHPREQALDAPLDAAVGRLARGRQRRLVTGPPRRDDAAGHAGTQRPDGQCGREPTLARAHVSSLPAGPLPPGRVPRHATRDTCWQRSSGVIDRTRDHLLLIRLRHRRWRLRRQRAREPAVRGSGQPGPGPGSRPAGLLLGRLHPHAGCARVPDRQPLLRLEVRVRARAVHARPARVPRPRQGARRVELDQRDDLPAGQPDGLRALGGRSRDGDLGPRALPAVLQADGELPRGGGRRCVPRPRRAARARARPGEGPAVRRVLQGRAGGRLPAHRRRERLPPGGLRGVRPQRAQRPPAVGRARVPAPGDGAPQPRGEDARVRHGHPLRGQARRRRRLHAQGPSRQRDRARRRGHPVRRRDQLAPAAPALGRRRRVRAARARHRRRGRPARRGGEPPGPPRGLHPAHRHAARDDGAVLRDEGAAEGRPGVAAAQDRPGCHEPLRGRRLRALERRGRLPEPHVPLPADRGPLRRHAARGRRRARLPGPRRPDVLRRARHVQGDQQGPAQASRR